MSFNIYLLLIINLLLIITCIYILKGSFTRIYLSGILFVTFLIIYNSILSDFSSLNINSLLFVTISNTLIFLTSIFLSSNKTLFIQKNYELDKANIYRFYLLSICSLFVLYLGIGSLDKIMESWIEVKDELQAQNFYRSLSSIFFFLSLSELRKLVIDHKPIKYLLPGILILILFILIIRVKMFIIPFLLIYIIPSKKNIDFKQILKASIIFPIIYLSVMFFRWSGDYNTFSIDKVGIIFNSVIEAGIEREMFYQYNAVFDHYFNLLSNPDIGGSYLKFITEPFVRIFNLESFPNPMYKYHMISNNYVMIQGGSAHPSIYGDSYASFGLFGCLIPSLFLIFTSFFAEKTKNQKNSLLFVGYALGIALIIRGSRYYGMLYFTIILLLDCILNIFTKIRIHEK